MQRLDEAYPPSIVVVCHSDLPRDGKLSLPTTIISRGKVESRENGHTLYSVAVTWRTQGAKESDAGDLTLTFRMNQRSDDFTPYSQTEITEFPAYITRNPGEAPSYYRKEVRDHA